MCFVGYWPFNCTSLNQILYHSLGECIESQLPPTPWLFKLPALAYLVVSCQSDVVLSPDVVPYLCKHLVELYEVTSVAAPLQAVHAKFAQSILIGELGYTSHHPGEFRRSSLNFLDIVP